MIAAVLAGPNVHIGKVYELTGPRSQGMHGLAAEYSDALGRTITYIDVPLEQWCDHKLRGRNLSDHVFEHLLTMAHLHAANRYDRLTHDVQTITGRPATSIRDFVAQHAEFRSLYGNESARPKRLMRRRPDCGLVHAGADLLRKLREAGSSNYGSE